MSNQLFDAYFTAPAMREIFSDRGRLQGMLDFEAALARAEASAGLVPHSAVAAWDQSRDGFTLWSSTQVPHYLHHQLSRVTGLPMARIRVVKPYIGGGFGGKAEATAMDFCAWRMRCTRSNSAS